MHLVQNEFSMRSLGNFLAHIQFTSPFTTLSITFVNNVDVCKVQNKNQPIDFTAVTSV